MGWIRGKKCAGPYLLEGHGAVDGEASGEDQHEAEGGQAAGHLGDLGGAERAELEVKEKDSDRWEGGKGQQRFCDNHMQCAWRYKRPRLCGP